MSTELTKRKEQIKSWIKDRYNLTFLIFLLGVIILRLYYFFLTKNQPLWWDETEYLLKAKNIAFGTADTGWWFGRPILFPVFAAIFFKLGLGEIGLRFFWAILSVVNVVLVYSLGKELFGKRVGLISSILYSFFYIDFFYSFRMLTDMPQTFFVLLAAYFFVNGYLLKKNQTLTYFILPALVVGVLLRFTVGLFFIILLVFLLLSEGFAFLKDKKLWQSIVVGIICYIPYWIWSYIRFNSLNPLYIIFYTLGTTVEGRDVTAFQTFMTYINYFTGYGYLSSILTWVFIIFFFIIVFEVVVSYDLIKKNESLKSKLLIVLWAVIPFIYFGFFVNHFEDRYVFMAFPAIFIMLGIGIEKIYNIIKKYNKNIAVIIVLLIVSIGSYQMYVHSSSIVNDKITSYNDLKDVGEWMHQNLAKGGVLSSALPEITYYAEMPVYPHSNISNDLELFRNGTTDYMVITNWERSPQYMLDYLTSNKSQFMPIYQSTTDYQGQKVFAVVFSKKKGAFI